MNYTAVIPFDEAFRAWYPIDWGFNPFKVDSFVRETLLNHFIVGEVNQAKVKTGEKFKTLGGKTVEFKKDDGDKLSINDIVLIEGGTPVPHGELLFINKLLFVNDDMVKNLNDEYAYLESGPLLPMPWYKSQFLSHSFELLSERKEYTYMSEYMNNTPEFGSYAEGPRK